MFAFDFGNRMFNNGARELEMVPVTRPAWEDSPELFPFDFGVNWRKRLADAYIYDVGGAPYVTTWQGEPAAFSGDVNQSGASTAVALSRNLRSALSFDGVTCQFTDTNSSSDTLGEEWTIFVALRPRRFTFNGGGGLDGDGVFSLGDYYLGMTMWDDAGTPRIRLFAFQTDGATLHSISVPVYTGRWTVMTAKFGRDLVIRLNKSTDAAVTDAVTTAIPTLTPLLIGFNAATSDYGNFEVGAIAIAPSGSWPDSRVRDCQRYLEAVYGPSKRCIVDINGTLSLVPKTSPYGKRIVLTSGVMTQAASTGKSLTLVNGQIEEISEEVDAIIPPGP